MSSAATAINVIRAANLALALVRELGVSYQELADLMEQAEQEGRDLTLNDLESLQDGSEAARESLRKAIEQSREAGI